MQEIKNRITDARYEDWRRFEFLQGEDFKELEPETKIKITNSIIENNFTEVFYAWENENRIICIDGYQRIKKIFPELEKRGYTIPEKFMTVFIECANETEAAKLVMQYNSYYSKVTQQGAEDHIKHFRLDFHSLHSSTMIPEIDLTEYMRQKEYEQIQIKDEQIKPYARTHILISFSPDRLIELKNLLEPITKLGFVEYEQSSN